MLKKTFKALLSIALFLGVLNAEPIEQNGKTKGIDVSITSPKSLIVGNNIMQVVLSKDGKDITNGKVKIKVFMPEMPGMPYMEYKAYAKFKNGKYILNVNYSMGGTWQYQLQFKTKDNKKYKVRGSVNI